MKKKGVVILCAAVAAAAAVGLLCWRFLGNRNGGKGDNVVYVNTVEKLMSLGSGNGMMNRFAGVVESQETWSVQQNQEKTVKEILVSVGTRGDGRYALVYLRYGEISVRFVPGTAGPGTHQQ